MNRRAFLQTTARSTILLAAAPPWASAADARTVRSDDDLLAEARERILRNRRSDGVILVRDASGKPLPGASVRVEQQRHEFLFGANFFRFARITDAEREQQYRERFAGVFNFGTLGFYWSGYEAARGRPSYAYSERV